MRSSLPLVLAGATLDEAAVGTAAPTAHAFRAGADWREPDWPGPPLAFGDAHPGTWRDTRSAPAGRVRSRRRPSGCRCAPAAVRCSWSPSAPTCRPRAPSTTGGVARLALRYPRDGRAPRPVRGAGARRGAVVDRSAGSGSLQPFEPIALEAAFTGFGSGDGDEEWQHHRYLVERPDAALPARRDVQLERNRRQRDLHRREGRHGPRHRAAGRARSRAGSGSRRSSSTTAGRRSPATGTPTRRSTRSRAAPRRASPTPSSARCARRSRR